MASEAGGEPGAPMPGVVAGQAVAAPPPSAVGAPAHPATPAAGAPFQQYLPPPGAVGTLPPHMQAPPGYQPVLVLAPPVQGAPPGTPRQTQVMMVPVGMAPPGQEAGAAGMVMMSPSMASPLAHQQMYYMQQPPQQYASPQAPPPAMSQPPAKSPLETPKGLRVLNYSRRTQTPDKGGRKGCNCKNSRCLKLYCECFARGEYCSDECSCQCCHNKPETEDVRREAILATLERNEAAFRPKIGSSAKKNDTAHIKGCRCTRSKCLKRYCECFQAGILCTDACKCKGCKNTLHSAERLALVQLATSHHQQQQHQHHHSPMAGVSPGRPSTPASQAPTPCGGCRVPCGGLPAVAMPDLVQQEIVTTACRHILQAAAVPASSTSPATPLESREKQVLTSLSLALHRMIDSVNETGPRPGTQAMAMASTHGLVVPQYHAAHQPHPMALSVVAAPQSSRSSVVRRL